MKRIQAACICQTLHFQLKDGLYSTLAVKQVQEEVAKYKQSLIQNNTRHKILEETVQTDGSVILKLIKQYNNSPVGDYLN